MAHSAFTLVDRLRLGGDTPSKLGIGLVAGLVGVALLAGASSAVSPIAASAAVIGAAVTAGIIISPTFGVMVVIFVMPFERLGRFTEDSDAIAVSLSRIFGLIAIASLAVHVAVKRRRLYFNTACKLYAGYVGIAALGILWALVPEETRRDALRLVGNLLFLVLLVNVLREWKLVRLSVVLWLVATIGTCAYSVYDYYIVGSTGVEEAEMGLVSKRFASSVVADNSETGSIGMKVKRAFGPTAHPAIFGLNLTLSLPFFIWAIRTERRRWMALVWLGGLMFAALNILLANTRAVLLLAAITVLACITRRLLRLTPQSVCALCLMGLMIVPFIPEDVYRRALDPTLYTATKGQSIRMRLKLLSEAWTMFGEYWVGGIGVGNQTTIVERITDEHGGRITSAGIKASAHNEYLWTAVETGIFGWMFHWAFVGWVTWSSFRSARLLRRWPDQFEAYWLAVACQVGMVGILLFALQTEAFHLPIKGWWLMIAICCFLLDYARRRAATEASAPATAAA